MYLPVGRGWSRLVEAGGWPRLEAAPSSIWRGRGVLGGALADDASGRLVSTWGRAQVVRLDVKRGDVARPLYGRQKARKGSATMEWRRARPAERHGMRAMGCPGQHLGAVLGALVAASLGQPASWAAPAGHVGRVCHTARHARGDELEALAQHPVAEASPALRLLDSEGHNVRLAPGRKATGAHRAALIGLHP